MCANVKFQEKTGQITPAVGTGFICSEILEERQRWHDGFAECMRAEGFFPCIAEPDIWMRANGDVCECVAVCVDD